MGFHNPVLLTAFGTQKGRKTVSFLCPSGFRQTLLSLLECMAGTTGLEPATSAVTVLPFEVFQRLAKAIKRLTHMCV